MFLFSVVAQCPVEGQARWPRDLLIAPGSSRHRPDQGTCVRVCFMAGLVSAEVVVLLACGRPLIHLS
jgi:hypothetical protein